VTLALVEQDVEAQALAEEQGRKALALLLRDELIPAWRAEKERLDRIDRWYRWDPEMIELPRGATRELRALRELARVPWLGLVVTSTAQCMYVDGWHAHTEATGPEPVSEPDEDANPAQVSQEFLHTVTTAWKVWEANNFGHRQTAIHRTMLAFGYTYVTVLPGVDHKREATVVMRGVSPRRMFAFYEDPAADDWPVYAIQMLDETGSVTRLKLYDDETVRTISLRNRGIAIDLVPELVIEKTEHHGAGVCPVVRYCNQLDLEGRTPGEIEPHIPIAARINKTSYDRMLVQHFNSWKIRTATGMAEPDTDEEANRDKLRLRQDDILIAEDPDTRFGTLDETSLDGFIRAGQTDVEILAAVTQTPTHELTGTLINVSAEGLAALRASQQAKVGERQMAAGSGHAQALRLACHLLGDAKGAADFTGRVSWQDTSIRSLAQAVDALGKAHQMLKIPAQALWAKIPGVSRTDVEEWAKLAAALDPIERMRAELDREENAPPQENAPPPDDGLE